MPPMRLARADEVIEYKLLSLLHLLRSQSGTKCECRLVPVTTAFE
jgi:hypothetical protein